MDKVQLLQEITPADVQVGYEIGSGQSGIVYSATCLGVRVAVKRPLKPLLEEFLIQFDKEIGFLKSFNHPNVVRLLGACSKRGYVQIVTEKCDGDLADFISKTAKITEFVALNYAYQIAKGMDFLHREKATVHCDLKPANILLLGNVIKIADFGHSKASLSGAQGTPLWCSPEILRYYVDKNFPPEVDQMKADVYSFAIIFWQLLTTNATPFSQYTNLDDLRDAVIAKNVRPPLDKSMNVHVRALLEQCWHAVAGNRPDFYYTVREIFKIILEITIPSTLARDFWRENFKDEFEIPYISFIQALANSVPLTDVDLCNLKHLIETNEHVTIEKFGLLIAWFGDIFIPDTFQKFHSISSQDWFRSDIKTHEEAQGAVGNVEGTFLVRTNRNKTHINLRIKRENGVFSVGVGAENANSNQTERRSTDFVNLIATIPQLRFPCRSSSLVYVRQLQQ